MRFSTLSKGRWSLSAPLLVLLLLLLVGSNAVAQTTVTSVVTDPFDDMEEYVASGGIDFNSSDLEIVNEGGGDQLIGLRFPAINIPQGAYITNATIQFTADETNTGVTTLTIRGEASDNAALYANASFSVSPRPRTTALVNWTVNPWNVIQERGADQRSPNLKAIVQEIVNRPGWSANNALAVVITGSGKRVAESQEGATSGAAGHAASQAATITIEYTIPTTFSVRVNAGSDDAEENVATGAMDLTSSDIEITEDAAVQYIGLRFNNVNVPTGATIVSAYIQFATDELFSNPTSVTVRGQAADNPTTFTSTAGNISSRALTAATSPVWSPAPWAVLQEAGPNQRTTDIAAVVQEIVNRPGWSSFNSMVMRISGTGKRTAEAYDGSTAEAPQLVVRYVTTARPVAPIGVFPVPKSAIWKYLDNGSDQGTAWRASNFNDSTWAFGPAQLGYGDGDEATLLGYGPDPNNKPITSYFRHTFNVTNTALATFDSLEISVMRDDGAIVYLNGTEVARSNMPAGTIGYRTPAASNVGGAAEGTYYTFKIGKGLLVTGQNVLAVEVHQDLANSSDLSFNFGLVGKKNDMRLIASGAIWEYYDKGAFPGSNWYEQTLTDTNWKLGPSILGYGNGNESTKLSFGPNPASKYPTAYFRRTFNVPDTAFGSLLLRLKRDDGAAVYLNGVELLRSNMPMGALTNLTLATDFVEGSAESDWLSYYVSRSLLRQGSNVIAVEVHQNSVTSTDLAFDLELTLQEPVQPLSPVNTGTNIVCNPASSGTIGCFTSVVPTAQTPLLIFPTLTHTFQRLIKSTQTRYTGSAATLPNGNDFTGFIPEGMTSSTEGHLSINHENTPGGVSMLELHYTDSTRLWNVDRIDKVDFSAVVQTVRNCSGGVTPWGTVITSEETFSTGDANADGWQDIGWQVEIDPATSQIRDYNGDGKPDKLWAMGRMSHENVVLASDSITAYQGEDGGTGCVYKFVAHKKARLDSGNLYVLRRDSPTATTGTWVQVPNTTKTQQNTVSTVAGALGGYRFGGVEDCEIAPDGRVYFTEKGRGDVWRFRDNGMTISGLEAWVTNVNYPINTERGTVIEPWSTGNDNLAFDGEGNLWVLQDGGKDFIWVVRPDHTQANPHIDLFATTPAASEPTGITFSPDYRFLFISFQNPSPTNTAVQKDAADSNIVWNASTTIVMSRREHLGLGSVAPRVNLGEDIYVCNGTPVEIAYSNRDAFHYWNDNSTDSVFKVFQSGSYYVTAVGNNGQVARDTVRVTFIDPPIVELGLDRTLCPGETLTLSAPASSSIVWDDLTTGTTRVIDRPGRFTVEVTDQTGCIARDTVNITLNALPQPKLGNDMTICGGTSVTLSPGAGFTSYLWSNGARTPSIQVATPGSYWVRVTGDKGCENFDTIRLASNSALSIGEDIEFCEGGSAVLNAGGGFASYSWSNGSITQTINVDKSGDYSVKVIDANGCESYDTVRVTAHALPLIELGRDTSICDECQIVLDAGPGYSSYRWSTGATTQTIIVDSTGRYSVTVNSDKGCTTTDDIYVSLTPLSGVADLVSNDKFSIRAYPNPFSSSVTIDLTLKQRSKLLVEVYDLNGEKITTLVNQMENAGEHRYSFNGDAFDVKTGVYLLKVTAGGKKANYKLVRK